MKINPYLLTNPALLGPASAAAQAGTQSGPSQAALLSDPGLQVELLADERIKMLLDAMGKTLGEFGRLTAELPPAAAREAQNFTRAAPGADTALPNGLTAMVRGARSGGEALAAYARTLTDAALVSEAFPGGLPPETAAAATAFASQASEGATFAAAMAAMAGPDVPVPEDAAPPVVGGQPPAAATASESQLPAAAPPPAAKANDGGAAAAGPPAPANPGAPVGEGAAPPPSGGYSPGSPPVATTAPGVLAGKMFADGDFAASLLAAARLLATVPDGEAALPKTVRALLAQLPTEPSAPAVRGDFAKAAAALARTIPASVQQAAAFHNLPELRDALVWQKLADSLPLLKLPAQALRQAGQTVADMAAAMSPQAQAATETADQQILVLAMPVFFGDGRAYPAYIHISRDRERPGGESDPSQRETWLRLCVATENLGLADMIFHLRGERQLTIRVAFSDHEAVDEFRRALPGLRETLAASPLNLADIAVVAAAGKNS